MPTLLHMPVSPRTDASRSQRWGEALVARFRETSPGLEVALRDLSNPLLPLPSGAFAEASLMLDADRGPQQHTALELSEKLIGELEAASAIVISTPIHNFTVPAALKAWIDYVVRPRRTFRSTPEGKVGLVADRPIFVVVACGGPFGEGAAAQRDFLSPYLRYALGSIRLKSIEILRLDNLNRGADHLAHAEIEAREWIGRQAIPGLS
jgi:FMN-dependent NADH-azoreductase